MGKPKLNLSCPADHTITLTTEDGASDSVLLGQLLFSNVPSQCDIQITLARVGRLKQGKEWKEVTASRKLMGDLGFRRSQKEQKREHIDYDTAEKLSGCFVSPPQATVGSKTIRCNFELPIPSYLPATTALPSVEISYAIFATCTLPDGKISQSSQDLRIIRSNAEPIRLESSRTVSFPESPLAVRARFDAPEPSSKNVVIPTTLQLQGLNLPGTNSMRINETRWLIPREIRWELEETAVLITGTPDATGHLPMSTAQRTLKKRNLSTGKQKLKLNYPFTRKGNSPILMLPHDAGMQFPFAVTAPSPTALAAGDALCVAAAHILHTVRAAHDVDDPARPDVRFAVYREYTLHVWLRIGEDVFDEASGDLVNRKMDEMAYTIVCPLTAQSAAQGREEEGDETPPVVPPRYDGVWELPPPGYATDG